MALRSLVRRFGALSVVGLTALVTIVQSTDLAQIVPPNYVAPILSLATILAAVLPSMRHAFEDKPEGSGK